MAVLGSTKVTDLALLDGVIGNLNPVTTGVYDLGTSSLKWRMLYGNVTGDLTGNASSATKLKNGRTFQIKDADNTNAGTASSAFTGESNLIINLPSTIKATLNGNATTASRLNITSTDNAIARFDGTNGTIQNSTATINDNGTMTIKGKLIVNPSYDTSNSYNEGIRINQASNGWANVHFGGAADSTNGAVDGGWLVGRRGAAGSTVGAVGDFTIEEQGSNGTGLTIHKDSNGATLYNSLTLKKADAGQGLILQTNSIEYGKLYVATKGVAGTNTTTYTNLNDSSQTKPGYSGSVTGQTILTLGNNRGAGYNGSSYSSPGSAGTADNSQGYLRLYSSSTGYGDLTAYTGDKTRPYPSEGFAIPENKIGIMFRPGSSSYYTHVSYETSGNEALVAATQNAVTSFIFVNGESYANVAADRWTKLTGASGAGNAPGLQIKQNCVSIGELITNGTTPTYKLNVNGTSNFKGNMQILNGGLEIKGHIAGDSSTTGHGLYSGGGYHNAYNNIILHGDNSTGSSGIAFISDKVSTDGTITNINQPSDRAFIQWHGNGITTYGAEGSAPTLATSGEVNQLIIGVGNDANDQIRFQTPGRTSLLHQIGNVGYVIPDTNNITGTVGSGTQPVWVEGGIIKNTTYTLAKSVPSDAKFTDTTYSGTNGISLSGTTFSNSGVRSTIINGNYLRVNTNGTDADLTIPYASTATTATKLGSSTLGSTTKPIYLDSGTPKECNTYAGGTAVTLNNVSKTSSTASFYAPTSGGTAGYILTSVNSTSEPTWTQKIPIANGGTGATTAANARTNLGLGTMATETATNYLKLSGGTMTDALYIKSVAKDNFIITPDKYFATADGTKVGAIKITLPVSWTATMMSMKADIYNYNNDNAITYTIGGYNFTGDGGFWTNCSANCYGFGDKSNLKVRFGHDGNKCCIIIGEIDTSWSYPKIIIRNILLGHSGTTITNWTTGWNIEWITSLPDNIDVIKENTNITYNFPTKTGTGASGSWGISITGNASTATKFASAQSITLTGDITGTVSSQAGWSIATTIGQNKVTNNMLAGSIANEKLVNSKVTIAGNEVSLGGSVDASTLRTSLGLSNALHFIGIATVAITDGSTTDPVISNYSTKTAGDVIIDKDSAYEYVWTGSKWERLGGDGSYKTTQNAVTSATAETTTATTFVHSVTQNANGVITVKTRPLPTYNNYSLPTATDSVLGGIKVGTTLAISNGVLNQKEIVTSANAKTYGNTSQQAPSYGGTFNIPYLTIDTYGRVTSAGTTTVKVPATDNTDTKQNITLATTSKAFVTGVTTTPTSSAQALTGVADTGVYLTTTAGEISAKRHSFNVDGTEKAYMAFNTTTNAIDFIFV